VVLGRLTDQPFFLNARRRSRPQTMRVPSVPGMGAFHIRWLVRGDGPYTVSVQLAQGGSDQRTAGP